MNTPEILRDISNGMIESPDYGFMEWEYLLLGEWVRPDSWRELIEVAAVKDQIRRCSIKANGQVSAEAIQCAHKCVGMFAEDAASYRVSRALIDLVERRHR